MIRLPKEIIKAIKPALNKSIWGYSKYIKVTSKKVIFTDGYILAEIKLYNQDNKDNNEYLLASETIKKLSTKTDAYISKEGNEIVISQPGQEDIRQEIVDFPYPDTESVKPAKNSKKHLRVKFDITILERILKIMKTLKLSYITISFVEDYVHEKNIYKGPIVIIDDEKSFYGLAMPMDMID